MSPKADAALKRVGARLGEARRARHLTRGQVAGLIGVSEGTVNRWEQGRANPTGVQLLRYMLLVGTSPEDLLGISKQSVAQIRATLKATPPAGVWPDEVASPRGRSTTKRSASRLIATAA